MIEAFKEIFILEKTVLDDVPPEEKANVLASIAKILEQKRKEKKQRQDAITRTHANDTEDKKAEAMISAARRTNETNESALVIVEGIFSWRDNKVKNVEEENRKNSKEYVDKVRREREAREKPKPKRDPQVKLQKTAPEFRAKIQYARVQKFKTH